MTYGQTVGGVARDKPIGAAEKKIPRQSAGNIPVLSCNTACYILRLNLLRASLFLQNYILHISFCFFKESEYTHSHSKCRSHLTQRRRRTLRMWVLLCVLSRDSKEKKNILLISRRWRSSLLSKVFAPFISSTKTTAKPQIKNNSRRTSNDILVHPRKSPRLQTAPHKDGRRDLRAL